MERKRKRGGEEEEGRCVRQAFELSRRRAGALYIHTPLSAIYLASDTGRFLMIMYHVHVHVHIDAYVGLHRLDVHGGVW